MVGATICKKEKIRGRLFAIVGCEIDICSPTLRAMSLGPSRSDWQGAFALYGVSVDYSHIDRAEEEYVYRPLDEPKLFNDRRRCAQHGGRLSDGSYYSWVDGFLWIDAALPSCQYDWSFNKNNSIYNESESDSDQWSDEDDFITFMWWTRVPWVLLCAEFQLGERAIESEVLLSYEHDYQRFIKS